jgi:nucleoside-diphosphate-sugar epimerase
MMSVQSHEPPILVTGAAGRIGSVGRMVTELLLARDFRVRAQVRVDDERAAMLRERGAEVVVGDDGAAASGQPIRSVQQRRGALDRRAADGCSRVRSAKRRCVRGGPGLIGPRVSSQA